MANIRSGAMLQAWAYVFFILEIVEVQAGWG